MALASRRCPLGPIAAAMLMAVSCVPGTSDFLSPPLQTQVSFLNLSKTMYVAIGVRDHAAPTAGFAYSALLAPGATMRTSWAGLLSASCPVRLDLQVLLYRRVHADQPIGVDIGEAVEPAPAVAGQIEDIPACEVQTLETFTIVNWDAPDGTARVKLGQCSPVDDAIQPVLGTASGAWEVVGVDPRLSAVPPPAAAPMAPITGRIVQADGSGVPGAYVLVRARYRVRLDCASSDNPADAGYGDPIAYAVTDDQGRFRIDRPAGVYELEFFSDTFAFRPGQMEIETPLDEVSVLAEPL